MRKSIVWSIIWSIIGVILLIAGGCLCYTAVYVKGYDFGEPEKTKFVTNTYEVTEKFSDLAIEVDRGNVLLLPSEDDVCRVICHEDEKEPHDVRVEKGILKIEEKQENGFGIYLGFNLESPQITVYLPQRELRSISAEVDSGAVTLKNVIATGEIKIETDAGKIQLEDCDAGSLRLETDAGDITGTLLSEKVFDARSAAGTVQIPDTKGGGNCVIRTSAGDIHMEIR